MSDRLNTQADSYRRVSRFELYVRFDERAMFPTCSYSNCPRSAPGLHVVTLTTANNHNSDGHYMYTVEGSYLEVFYSVIIVTFLLLNFFSQLG